MLASCSKVHHERLLKKNSEAIVAAKVEAKAEVELSLNLNLNLLGHLDVSIGVFFSSLLC